MAEYITDRAVRVKKEIDNVLRQMCFGRDLREFSEDTVERIFNTYVVQSRCVDDDIVVDEDIVVTALMEIVYELDC